MLRVGIKAAAVVFDGTYLPIKMEGEVKQGENTGAGSVPEDVCWGRLLPQGHRSIKASRLGRFAHEIL